MLKGLLFLTGLTMISCVGCHSPKRPVTDATPKEQLRPVAVIRWDADKERNELLELLREHGIHGSMEGEGTVIFRILVPASDWGHAVSLLRTNHLFIEGAARFPVTDPPPR
jgi:hypothetical protein